MRLLLWSACASFLLSTVAVADDKDEAKYANEVLNQAVKALGSPKKFTSLPALVCETDVTMTMDQRKSSFTGTWSMAAPDKVRGELQVEQNGETFGVTTVVNGKKGWNKHQGMNRTKVATDGEMKVFHTAFGAFHLSCNPFLLRNKNFKISPLGEKTIHKQKTTGIRVEQKGKPELEIYFSTKTHLPLQTIFFIENPYEKKEVEVKLSFEDYKKTGARQHFTKMSVDVNGKPAMTWTFKKMEFKEKLDKTLFQQP